MTLDRDLDESDHTAEIDFSDCDDFAECLEVLQQHEINSIGTGKYRRTWHHPFNSRLVVKIATPRDEANDIDDSRLRNLWEFLIWCRVRGTAQARRLAPCIDCEPTGLWLTQLKGKRLPRDTRIRGRRSDDIVWVGDLKPENWVTIGNQQRVVDYSTDGGVDKFQIPEDLSECQRLAASYLRQRGADVQDPWYGARPE